VVRRTGRLCVTTPPLHCTFLPRRDDDGDDGDDGGSDDEGDNDDDNDAEGDNDGGAEADNDAEVVCERGVYGVALHHRPTPRARAVRRHRVFRVE
jgi:hypothetical protein